MEKTYQPQQIEQHWYHLWEKQHCFKPSGKGEAYTIVIPPPNVTGSLHMGHGFGTTLMDVLIRYQRMSGKNTLWQPGSDHAGIATQMVVERQLPQGQTRHDLGRDAFVEKIWQWKETSGNRISEQFKRLGASMDWSRERFTMDETLSAAVRDVFIQLYHEGLIYRGTKLVNWDPVLLTAISDLEVLNEEESGHLWHIAYPIVDSKDQLIVATTRPETMLGDVAIAVHPDDERYQMLIGKKVHLPLTNRTIPIIADDYVEKDFGSGCVKITPAHDFNDYAIGQRHSLTPINIFTPNAHLNSNVPETYRGLERFVARKRILKDLDEQGLLIKTEKHTLKIPRGDRSGAVLEPYLTQQWFVKIKPLAEPAIKAVESGDIQFIPENWSKTYFHWMNNIEDWCISRQLWWGHRIPAWYDDNQTIYVGENEQAIRQTYQLDDSVRLTQENDVLDTWFSSALWPFSSLGWPTDKSNVETFYPTSVLVTGFDIIFFWVARMIMMGLKFTGKVPFRDVLITGLIRDSEGHKMSKSKGNVLDPLDLIEGISLNDLIEKRTQGLMQPKMADKIANQTRKHFPDGIAAFGTDALRFTFCALASHNREIKFDLNRLEGNRNFCNKLWNAARYVLMNTEDYVVGSEQNQLTLPDRWILAKLQSTIRDVHQALHDYRFDLMANAIYEFVWNEFCDWYLELCKHQSKESRHTLLIVLEAILRLIHPIMPFISEEIWQKVAPLVGKSATTIMLQPYPIADTGLNYSEAVFEVEWMKKIIVAIRTIRSEMNISPAKTIHVLFHKGEAIDKTRLAHYEAYIKPLAKIADIQWLHEGEQAPQAATAVVGELEILIPMADLINKEEEIARLNKEISRLEIDLSRAEAKLQNPQFVDKAPPAVVAKEKSRISELKTLMTKLEEKRQMFQS